MEDSTGGEDRLELLPLRDGDVAQADLWLHSMPVTHTFGRTCSFWQSKIESNLHIWSKVKKLP